jgi:hypothetical protein
MHIQLKFKNLKETPFCRISVNGVVEHEGAVNEEHNIVFKNTVIKDIALKIEFINKNPEDTVVKNGVIVKDKSFELNSICVDGYNFEELIWQSNYYANDGQIYPGCLFFGPPGYFEIKFHDPILHWILETRNKITGNDPDWEIDYNYYSEACKLLTLISIKSDHSPGH